MCVPFSFDDDDWYRQEEDDCNRWVPAACGILAYDFSLRTCTPSYRGRNRLCVELDKEMHAYFPHNGLESLLWYFDSESY